MPRRCQTLGIEAPPDEGWGPRQPNNIQVQGGESAELADADDAPVPRHQGGAGAASSSSGSATSTSCSSRTRSGPPSCWASRSPRGAKGAERVPMCGVPFHAARRYIGQAARGAATRSPSATRWRQPGSGPGIVRARDCPHRHPGHRAGRGRARRRQRRLAGRGERGRRRSRGRAAGRLHRRVPRPRRAALGSPELLEALRARAPGGAPPGGCRRPPCGRPCATALRHARRSPSASRRTSTPPGPRPSSGPTSASPRSRASASTAPRRAVGAAGAALRYLKDTQRTEARHVRRAPPRFRCESTLVLDETTRTQPRGAPHHEGRLAGRRAAGGDGPHRHRARAPAGSPSGCSRRSWTSTAIRARQDAVEELSTKARVARGLGGASPAGRGRRAALRAARHSGSGTPRDLAGLGRCLAVLPDAGRRARAAAARRCWQRSPVRCGGFETLAERLQRARWWTSRPADLDEGGFIRPGYSTPSSTSWWPSPPTARSTLLELEQRERARTGIGSLKVRYNRVFGYFLEVTRANLHLVPRGLRCASRPWSAPSASSPRSSRTTRRRCSTADEKRIGLERALFEELRDAVLAAGGRRSARRRDALAALRRAGLARAGGGRVRLLPAGGGRLGRARDRRRRATRWSSGMLGPSRFVPNDVAAGPRRDAQLLVITGPNMAGKSTVMRQVALIAADGAGGLLRPGAGGRASAVCDRIFTRVGASDNLARGQSTFMVEMTETAAHPPPRHRSAAWWCWTRSAAAPPPSTACPSPGRWPSTSTTSSAPARSSPRTTTS